MYSNGPHAFYRIVDYLFLHQVSPRLSLTNPQLFHGHTYYIMNIAINPKVTNTFATAYLDRTVKVWSILNPIPDYRFDAHEKAV
jgi:WD40 repeat protein